MTKKKQMPRAVAYIRVSDPTQVEGHSLDAQRKEITRWCESRGYERVAVYADEGVTARSDRIEKRPELMRLLEDAARGQFDIVVVHMVDRWARNVGVQRQAFRKLGEANVGFASATEEFDYTSPSGRLVLTMLGGVAEFQSDQLGLHVAKAQRHRAELGLPNGPVPFAYRTTEPGGTPQLDEREAKAVKEVFERRAQGDSNGSIAGWLNASGFRTRKGRMFTDHAIKDMLNTRFYVGKILYRGDEYGGQHTPIISENLFERVQAGKVRRSVTRKVIGPKGLLQGRLSCGNCGKGIQSDRHRLGEPMYRERHSVQCDTNGRSVVAKHFDEQIGVILQPMELQADWRDRMADLATVATEGLDPKKLQENRRRLARAYGDGAYSDVEYEERLSEIDRQIGLTMPIESPSLEEAQLLFENIPQLWNEATPEERRKLISPLIERVYVDIDSKLVGAVKPVPAFARLLDAAIVSANSPALTLLSEDETERLKVWSWWRRGRVELPVQKTSRLGCTTSLVGTYFSLLRVPTDADCSGASQIVFGLVYRRPGDRTSICVAHPPPSRNVDGERSHP